MMSPAYRIDAAQREGIQAQSYVTSDHLIMTPGATLPRDTEHIVDRVDLALHKDSFVPKYTTTIMFLHR